MDKNMKKSIKKNFVFFGSEWGLICLCWIWLFNSLIFANDKNLIIVPPNRKIIKAGENEEKSKKISTAWIRTNPESTEFEKIERKVITSPITEIQRTVKEKKLNNKWVWIWMIFFDKKWKTKNDAIRGIETKTEASKSSLKFVNNAIVVRLP